MSEMPPHVRLALRVLLDHVEPGWENCQATVSTWLELGTDKDTELLAVCQSAVDKAKEKLKVSCPWCAKWFTPKSHNHRFCCYEHKNLYHATERGADRKKKVAIAVL